MKIGITYSIFQNYWPYIGHSDKVFLW